MSIKISTLVMVTVLSLAACKDNTNKNNMPQQQGPQAIPARVEMPQVREVTEWDEFTGRFQASERVELKARVSGYLQEVKFDDGQVVEKGDVLFVIEQRPFQIALDSAKARFELANNEYKRAKNLRSSKAISEEDYDQRLQEMRIAKASLDEAKLNMDYTEVRAPFTGRTSRSLIDVGNLVNGNSATAATVLTTLVSTSPIELYFEGSEADLLRYIRARENGEVVADRGGPYPVFAKLQDEEEFVHKGQVNFLDNELSEDTGTIQVRAVFDNDKGLLEPGMFARIRIAMSKPAEQVIVPQHIIGTEQVRKYVYALDQDNKAVRKYVTLGSLTEDSFRVIKSGLTPNDKIIVGGLHMIQPGAAIMPIEGAPVQEGPQENAGESK